MPFCSYSFHSSPFTALNISRRQLPPSSLNFPPLSHRLKLPVPHRLRLRALPAKAPSPPSAKAPSPPPAKAPSPPPAKTPSPPPAKAPSPPPAKAPSPPPAKAPSPPPAKAPSPPPVKPPQIDPPKKVAVQGVVFCKACKFRGINTLLGASPLAGAVVKLVCNNTKTSLIEQTKTDKKGYFFFRPQKLTTAGYRKCRAYLVSSPSAKCSVPTNLHGGATGAILIPSVVPPVKTPKKTPPFSLFTVGPFAFEAHKKLPCHY
ncbi:hypothetical protein DH2020_032813 [Rehmannia glutinosa]|uniref:Pistil-specific extensin-like protein n=1 Tax=Rehmannia glutinosa TaxID=99300 RepID=A0ABR0VE24_REHGL